MHFKKIIPVLTLLICNSCSHAQDFSAYKKALFIHGADTLRYRILYPENYDSKKSYPLVVFLHGEGWRGNDNEKQLNEGGSFF